MHSVDLSPIYGYVNEFVGLLLAGLATAISGMLIAWLKKHLSFLGQQTDQLLANGLNTALANGTAIAMNKLSEEEAAHPSVEVKGLVASMAVKYAVNHAPDAVDRFGLTPAALANKALAYLPIAAATTEAIAAAPAPTVAAVVEKASVPAATDDPKPITDDRATEQGSTTTDRFFNTGGAQKH